MLTTKTNETYQKLFDDPIWSNGLYMFEKSKLLDEGETTPDNSELELDQLLESNEDFIQWVKTSGGNKDAMYSLLDEFGVSPENFKNILLDKDDRLYDHSEVKWFNFFKSIFEGDTLLTKEEYNFVQQSDIPFKKIVYPFLRKAKEIVIEQWESKYDDVIDQNLFLQSIYKALLTEILKLSSKTMIYELNKSRLLKELEGRTSEARYEHFLSLKFGSDEKIIRFLSQYPVLARLISESIQNITYNFLTVLGNFLLDLNEIEAAMDIHIDKIKTFSMLGDLHKDGKSVMLINFSHDSIIYKPRSLSIDIHFQTLLEWFNQKGLKEPLRLTKVINRDEYGWMEYIRNNECDSVDEICNFYEKQGEYLAILYLLNATDFHYENIIAAGDDPVLIDLESLFHNDINNIKEYKTSATQIASEKITYSVVRTSLLPVLAFDFIFDMDVSGLGGGLSQQISRYRVANLETDKMKMELTEVMSTQGKNLPIFKSELQTPDQFIDDIKRGFRNAYKLIQDNLEELKSANGPIAMFGNDEIRLILRNTIVYSKLLEASTHPKYLQDGLERDKLLLYLWRLNIELPDRKETIISEHKEMLRGDIPYFSAIINSKNIMGDYKKEIDNILKETSLSFVMQRLNSINEEDCKLQLRFIDETFQTKYYLSKEYNTAHTNIRTESNLNYLDNKEEFLQGAINIGENLLKDAIWGHDNKTVTWLGMGMNEDEKLQYKVMDIGLYNGSLGMALFFAYLGKESRDERFTKIAKACVNTALSEDLLKKHGYISAFSGYGSVVYVLNQLSSIWKDESLNEVSKKYINKIAEHINGNKNYDLLNGLAGTLIVCLDFYTSTSYKKALEIAIRCGDSLISNASKMREGVAWPITATSTPLAGLSHGNTGISLALLKLYDHTKKSEYLECALAGIEYENSLYVPKKNNWMDLRVVKDKENPEFSAYWCNGAPGIGIGRLYMLDYYESDSVKEDLKRCLDQTLATGFNNTNYSLCHGDFGNLELILNTAIKANDKALYNESYKIASNILEYVREDNNHWKCGIPGGQQTPNFMVGMSGIGYSLLRFYNNNIPSVIGVLEPQQ
ncbi:hypothetical protein CHH64_00565 [Terribacillus saccharophilus]|uniref:Lantibiotic biosynthesis protein dehydration domain-containing protein n=1 Tax=Terribacillus saccharophilus TaxID=361277 RepID=A0A268AG96_9BACI|nr:hypothetical protein CHH64_00565 [Terribacillus saccharophilus]